MPNWDLSYWVVQRVKGELIFHGPYKTEQARDNRYDVISGGELHKFTSLSSQEKEARQEFHEEEARVG
jgi:hypothetical protein